MITIWKFVLEQEVDIEITEGYEILSVGEQDGDICVWIKLDTKAPSETVKISVFGTGWDIPDRPMQFIGLVLMRNGLVFHAFKRLPQAE